MPVVIDGNNLLYAARRVAASDVLMGRATMCDALGRWAQRRRERVHVVFDGPAPPAGLAAQIAKAALAVSYSGAGVSADVVIANLIETDSAARRLIVVSSDRSVSAAAKRRRARPVKSEDFWARVERDLARPVRRAMEPPEKRAGLEPGRTEEWLDEFGLR